MRALYPNFRALCTICSENRPHNITLRSTQVPRLVVQHSNIILGMAHLGLCAGAAQRAFLPRMNSLSGVERIYVMSKSVVKQDAIVRWLRSTGRAGRMLVHYIDPAETGCPQPFGEHSAFQCLARRHPSLHGGGRALWIGIENYVRCTPHGVWHDCVAVSFTYVTKTGLVLTVMTSGQFGNLVPREFAPVGGPDLRLPLGYSETVGARIHAAHADVPHDDWAKYASPLNVDRCTQIVDALRILDVKINEFARQ